jgi:hypothetical protein
VIQICQNDMVENTFEEHEIEFAPMIFFITNDQGLNKRCKNNDEGKFNNKYIMKYKHILKYSQHICYRCQR